MGISRGWEEGEMGRYWSRGTKLQVCKMTKFWRSNVQHDNDS